MRIEQVKAVLNPCGWYSHKDFILKDKRFFEYIGLMFDNGTRLIIECGKHEFKASCFICSGSKYFLFESVSFHNIKMFKLVSNAEIFLNLDGSREPVLSLSHKPVIHQTHPKHTVKNDNQLKLFK